MIEIPKWMRELDPATLPEQYRKLSDIIGYNAMLGLVAAYSGDYVYVPKLDALIKQTRDKHLIDDLRAGVSPSELAHKYNLSVVQVYEIIKRERGKAAIQGKQISLFGEDAS